jgi:hypothetical protein
VTPNTHLCGFSLVRVVRNLSKTWARLSNRDACDLTLTTMSSTEAGLTDYNPALTLMEERLKLSRDSTTEEVDVTQYWHLVGSLHYLAHTQPDLTFFVGYVSRFMQ